MEIGVLKRKKDTSVFFARGIAALVFFAGVAALAIICVATGSAQAACLRLGNPYCLCVISDAEDEYVVSANGNATPALLETQFMGSARENIFSEAAKKATSDAPSVPNLSNAPTILIYHTHTLEAYTPTAKNPYTARGGRWRTTDESKSVVAIGEMLKKQLQSYGFNVLHDTTNHEPPKLSTAYARSEKTMKAYKKKYPSLNVFIDIHRDASGADGKNDYVTIDGEEVARLMFVVGTGKGATGTGFDEMPDFEKNYALASAVTDKLTAVNQKLARKIRVKTGRYNQHISSACMLIEVGHNMNTLEQAQCSVKYLAKALADTLNATK